MMNKINLNDYKICHKCGGKMTSGTVNESIKVDKKEIILKGLNGYCCEVCGEIIFSSEELKKIDKIVRAFFSTDELQSVLLINDFTDEKRRKSK